MAARRFVDQRPIGGDDSIIFDPDVQQLDREIPKLIKFLWLEAIGQTLWMDSKQKQNVGAKHIPDSSDH